MKISLRKAKKDIERQLEQADTLYKPMTEKTGLQILYVLYLLVEQLGIPDEKHSKSEPE